MAEFSKKTKKQLKELMIKADAKELDQALLKLSEAFDAWEHRQIDCWQLEELIHKFHNDHARKLFNYYNSKVDPVLIISSALSRNLIQKEDIPDEALTCIEHCLHHLFEDKETEERIQQQD